MNILKNTTIIVMVSLSVAISQTLSAAEVRKISPEVLLDSSPNKVWRVSVLCAEIDEARFIERAGETGKWCAKELPTACSRKKVKIAKKVCGTHFERNVAKYRASQGDAAEEIVNQGQQSTASDTGALVAGIEASESEIGELPVDSEVRDKGPTLTQEILEIEEEKVRLQKKKLELERLKLELEKQKQTQ